MQYLKRLAAPLTLVALAGLAFLGWQSRWEIYDYFRLRNYTPPQRVVAIADATTMDKETRELFYVYYPSIEPKEEFRTHCTNAEVTIVLGCYIAGDGIYLADITDKRLDGIVEVTAAHEVLHAAYDRLEQAEKDRLSKMLHQTYDNLKNDRIKKTVEEYRANGADVTNELHSIIGTEVRDIPKELEEYYSQYFNDRLAVVALSEKYEATFNKLKARAESLDKQAKQIAAEIDRLNQSISAQAASISAERERMNWLLEQDRVEEYNAAVPGFNRMVDAYNADVRRVGSLIDRYNSIIGELKEIAIIQNELYNAIDSRPEQIKQ